MSTGIISKKYLIDIANAIREKCNTQSQYTPSQMPSAIQTITDDTIKTIDRSSNNEVGFISDDLYSAICDAVRYANDDQSLRFTAQEIADAILVAPRYSGFSLFDQPGLVGTGYGSSLFQKQSDGSWYSAQGANTTFSWSIPIPKEYKYLAIDVESTGRTRQYNISSLALTTQYGSTGQMGNNYKGTLLRSVSLTNYSYTNPKQASTQKGVAINPTSQYVVQRQIVYVDISDVNQDTYLFSHRCDNATTIHSVKALMQIPVATYSITYTPGDVCTATDDTNTYTAPDTSGTWTINGHILKLTVTAVNEDSGIVVTKIVNVNFENGAAIDVSTLMTVNITYTPGDVCTATDDTNTYTAPDTSGTWTLNGYFSTLTISTTERTVTVTPNPGGTVYVNIGPMYSWTPYSIYDGSGLTASGWTDTSGTKAITKNSGSWTIDHYKLVANGSTYSFPTPGSNILIGWRGTISSGWTPNGNSAWCLASCLFGKELKNAQKDFGCIIGSGLKPAIGYSSTSIAQGSVSLTADTEYTIFMLHTGSKYYLWVDGNLVASVSYTASGSEITSMGLFWNGTDASTVVKGTCSKLGVWTFNLENQDGSIVLPDF